MIRLLLIALSVAICSCTKPHSFEDEVNAIAKRVARLGFTNDDGIANFEALAKTPRISVRILIDSLVIITNPEDAAELDSPNTEHAIEMIRFLRFLTGGKDFCSVCAYAFGSSEEENHRKYWLTLRHGECLTFFANWPSRGRLYIAPTDVQEQIIMKWRDWYKTEGFGFDYRPIKKENAWELAS